ncbi:hypothetical protein [Bradyrhizobium sp. 613_E4_N2_2]|uniref:hypothetical protein n=1 Tax=Bradyrhizobium sp. 613_E4_N2_2 TaxID=3240371 RepID=UPI003F893126
MGDVIDQAQAFDALNLEQGLQAQAAKAAAAPKLTARGYCLNEACEEPLALPAQLFCNSACEREHSRRSR